MALPIYTGQEIANLAKPEVLETLDAESILADMSLDLLQRYPILTTLALESEPATKILEVAAYREVIMRARVNDGARANLLAYSLSTDMDHLGAFYECIRMTDETDSAYRTRIILAIMSRSTGGTVPRYAYIARTASVRVKSAVVYPDKLLPYVNIAIYSTDNGGIADAALLAEVTAAVTDPSVVMVNDTMNVRAAVRKSVDIEADIYLLPETSVVTFDNLEAVVRASWDAETGMGFDLNRVWLTARLMQAGIYRVDLITPQVDQVASPFEALELGTITLNNKGGGY